MNLLKRKKELTNKEFIYIMLKAQAKFSSGGGIMKRTYQPNNRKKAKKHGFFARMKGNIINKRRAKGRKVLAH